MELVGDEGWSRGQQQQGWDTRSLIFAGGMFWASGAFNGFKKNFDDIV